VNVPVRPAAPAGSHGRRRGGAGRPAAIALLLVVLAASARAAGPTDILRVDDLIVAPRLLFGRTRAEIETRLGPPSERRRAVLPTTRDPAAFRSADELAYPGLTIQMVDAAHVGRVVLTTGSHVLPHGLAVGAPLALVERILGEAQQTRPTSALYLHSDGYPETVELFFRDGQVARIEWTYWVE
jgi:hypothetical protein